MKMTKFETDKEKLTSPFDSWTIKDGDYSREGYSYDRSHEELLKDEKRTNIIWSSVFLTLSFIIIVLIIHFMSTI